MNIHDIVIVPKNINGCAAIHILWLYVAVASL